MGLTDGRHQVKILTVSRPKKRLLLAVKQLQDLSNLTISVAHLGPLALSESNEPFSPAQLVFMSPNILTITLRSFPLICV